MVFARWGSNTIRRYIRETPLEQLTELYRRCMAKHQVEPPISVQQEKACASSASSSRESARKGHVDEDRLRQWAENIKGLVEKVNQRMADQEAELAKLGSKVGKLCSPIIFNPRKNVYHFCPIPISSPPASWKTRCGWPFAHLPHERFEALTEGLNRLQARSLTFRWRRAASAPF